MKNLFIYILLVVSTQLSSQIIIKPQCDEALEIPYTFTYNGFLIFDQLNEQNPEGTINLKIEIVEDQVGGNVLYTESHWIPFRKSGFFSIEIGSQAPYDFELFLDYLNKNTSKEYYIDVSVRQNNNYTFFGSKKIQTVPYALVANALGGKGEVGEQGEDIGEQGARGQQGEQGQQGIQGQQGQQGETGINDFEFMKMSNSEPDPIYDPFYVDDGTNTADGKPHFRYFDTNNNVWVDL